MSSKTSYRSLLVSTALAPASIVSVGVALWSSAASAQTGSTDITNHTYTGPAKSDVSNQVTTGAEQDAQSIHIKKILVAKQRQILREKNSPSAATKLGSDAILQTGVQGSVATLLRQAPSVYVYQFGIGNNEPVLSLRGARGLETAQTYDGVPMQDLLNGGTGQYLQNLLGGRFNLDQISNVTIYPGVAFPNKNTFGTIGGTIAYESLRPAAEAGVDVIGSIGSFGTYQEGFAANSGKLDGVLGTGYDAPSILLKYTNLQTNGFIDYTPARYNNMEFAFDKPYNEGLSKFEATVLYNTGDGLTIPEPIPVPYLQQNGNFSNYSPDQEFTRQNNDYLTFIFKDDNYINQYLSLGGSLFYIHTDSDTTNYGNPSIFAAPGSGIPGSVTVGGAAPFNQTIAGFGGQGAYGPGAPFYQPGVVSYDGNAAYPPGSAGCPLSVSQQYAAAGLTSPCGYNALYTQQQNDTYGIQPRATISIPEYYGFVNTIQTGGLIAKETSPLLPSYIGGTPNFPHTPETQGGLFGGAFNGGTQRTIYQVYAQDKIDTLQNTLHLTPGLTFEGTGSSYNSGTVFGGTVAPAVLATPYCSTEGNTCAYGAYKATKWDRELLPFFNISYDLDRIIPAARGTSLYGSYGESALFAPVTDFSPSAVGGSVPYASIVHLFEYGAKYNTSKFSLNADYYYQKVDRDFGFFQYQGGPLEGLSLYTNLGERQYQGEEFSGTYQIDQNWQLFGNFSHIRAVYLKQSLASVTIQEDQFGFAGRGDPVSGIPDWLSTFGVDYDHKNWFLAGDEFHTRFEGQYTGRQATTYDVNGFSNVGSFANSGIPPFGTYLYYQTTAGATTYDPNGGIEPFILFNWDINYKLPLRQYTHGYMKSVDFDLNILNLFNKLYYQYVYKQVSPASCPNFTSGPFAGLAQSSYSCGQQFKDALPGEPFAITFTATAHF